MISYNKHIFTVNDVEVFQHLTILNYDEPILHSIHGRLIFEKRFID